MAVKTFGSERLVSTDINTYLANAGLVYVKSQTVTGGAGVTTVTVTSAFSATYDNYLITWTGGNMDGNADISINLGPTSVTGWNTGYYTSLIYASGNPGAIALAQVANSSYAPWIGGGNSTTASIRVDVFMPFLTEETRMINGTYQAGIGAVGTSNTVHTQAQSYSDFTLTGGGGAKLIGGTINVYGYRKA